MLRAIGAAMSSRQTLPRLWLLTDRRLGDELFACLARVPRGAGVVLRHHESDVQLGRTVAQMCAERGLMLGVAGDVAFARHLGAAMAHNPEGEARGLLVSRSVHDPAEAAAARAADLVFVSPVHASASHVGGTALGLGEALTLAAIAAVPAIALGGMNRARGDAAMAAGFHGWGAIDAWRNDDA
jgi:thiamine-phosphate pyrophosphorylase